MRNDVSNLAPSADTNGAVVQALACEHGAAAPEAASPPPPPAGRAPAASAAATAAPAHSACDPGMLQAAPASPKGWRSFWPLDASVIDASVLDFQIPVPGMHTAHRSRCPIPYAPRSGRTPLLPREPLRKDGAQCQADAQAQHEHRRARPLKAAVSWVASRARALLDRRPRRESPRRAPSAHSVTMRRPLRPALTRRRHPGPRLLMTQRA